MFKVVSLISINHNLFTFIFFTLVNFFRMVCQLKFVETLYMVKEKWVTSVINYQSIL